MILLPSEEVGLVDAQRRWAGGNTTFVQTEGLSIRF